MMKRIALSPSVVLGILLLLTCVRESCAQSVFPESNGKALKGLPTVVAGFVIVSWGNIGDDRMAFKNAGQMAFELGLRRDGIEVTDTSPAVLFCSLAARDTGTGLIAYHIEVELYALNPDGLNPLLWTAGMLGTVGKSNFRADDQAKSCVDMFSNEWLKQNPKH